jgi:aquaporin Z
LGIGGAITALILSPWGKQSGGHFNPAVTFTYYRLGKVEPWDALFYITAQFSGAIAGVAITNYLLLGAPQNPAVRCAVTSPGLYGMAGALIAEIGISLVLMTTVLFATNRGSLARYTAYFVGALYAIFITFEAPLSGMSMNPARTFASAIHAGYVNALWIYFIAPLAGMLGAAELFLRVRRGAGPMCAKLHHDNNKRCIFRHGGILPRAASAESRLIAQGGPIKREVWMPAQPGNAGGPSGFAAHDSSKEATDASP